MSFALVLDEVFSQHQTPVGHPERPERTLSLIEEFSTQRDLARIEPVSAKDEWILRVHTDEHFQRIRATAERDSDSLDLDTQTSALSFEVAMKVAGSGVHLVDQMFRGEIGSGFLLGRPPGHHAESNRAMGFCLFNNVAIAAQWALDESLVERVAIVDFDVHHGNGTQEIFYDCPEVLYISSHQHPLYPGTGTFDQTGEGEGVGSTVNLPIRAGMGDGFYGALYLECVAAVLEEFDPGLILISAGYDPHRDDPLAGMNLTEEGFAQIVAILERASHETCSGRILYFLEGGYSLPALARSAARTVEVAKERPEAWKIDVRIPDGFSSYLSHVREAHGRHWKALA